MNRINDLFKRKKNDILNVYCTAGYPKLDSTVPVMKALQDSGVDMIELGMPYSDPLADGPVIQASSTQALANGMTRSEERRVGKECRSRGWPEQYRKRGKM